MRIFLCISPFLQVSSLLRILQTPIITDGNGFTSSFASVKNPQNFTAQDISVCFWVSVRFESKAEILSGDEGTEFLLTFRPDGTYVQVHSYQMRFNAGKHFIPEKWLFWCLTYDNSEKMVKIYQN